MANAIDKVTRDILSLNKAEEITITEKSAACGLDMAGGDYKTLILFANAGVASATATLAIGNGIQGVGADTVITVGAGKTMGIVVDSGYFKNVSGDYKDTIKVTPSAALNVSVIELPQ